MNQNLIQILLRSVGQPLAGKAFNLFPKQHLYLSYLGVFEVGSLVCAAAPTSKALIIGRAVAGLGASGIFSGGLVILATVIPLHKRPVWTGTLMSTFVIASIIGPLIGSALTEHVSWRWCFYINLPIGWFTAAVVLVLCRIKNSTTEEGSFVQKLNKLDGVGFVLIAGSISTLLLALQFGGITFAWNSSQIIGLFVGFAVVITLYIAWQLHLQDNALVPPKVFANRNSGLIFCSMVLSPGPFQVIIYFLPIWFQAVLAKSPAGSGVSYLPTVISDVLTSVIGAAMAQKLGIWKPFLVFGTAMVSLGAGLLTTLHPGISTGHWIGYQILVGIGYSFSVNMVSFPAHYEWTLFLILLLGSSRHASIITN
jgi:MFS family permease